MTRPPLGPITRSYRIALHAAVAFGIGILASGGVRGQDPVKTDREKKAAEIEKQIEQLKAELAKLKVPEPAVPKEKPDPLAGFVPGLRWRCVGPANMGGRITAIAVSEQDSSTFWIATASGGLIKTANNGSTFEHQFDKEGTVSIGSVAVAPSDKNVLYVGTGEANPRNSVSYGDGVYKSTDGGKTWANVGLKKSYQIGKVVIHPKDPNTVYVAALGRLYGPSAERGLYKTTDGGKTWNRILFVDDRTGALDIALQPGNPECLLIATWERARDQFDSFRGDAKFPVGADDYAPSVLWGRGAGIHKTTDGGKTFTKLTKGLPKVAMGRIGIDYYRKNPNTVFATIDTEKTGGGNPAVTVYMGVQGDETYLEGAKIVAVTDGGPAQKAGLKAGDIIVKFAGTTIANYSDLRSLIAQQKAGEKLKIEVLRAKDKLNLEIALAARDDNPPSPRAVPNFGVPRAEAVEGGGLKIVTVRAGSPAEKAGIKPDDILLSIDGSKLTDTKSMVVALQEKKAGDKVKLNYLRGDKAAEVEVVLVAANAATAGRPNIGNPQLGGQRANVQDSQGPDGFDTGGIFRSDDNGDSWTRVNSANERPFYFSVVRVDPADDQTVFTLGVELSVSRNGGKYFTKNGVNKGVHSDLHDMWIDPKDGRHLLIGGDGGIYVTFDRGANWEHLNTVAMGQFYHVAVDNRRPYNVYGGLQDNGSWGGPSETNRAGSGPANEDYRYINGGDGFVMRVDPTDPDVVYSESQDGMMNRKNLKTGGGAFIRPRAQPGLSTYRFNWNTPFIVSGHNPGIFYSAGNYVFKSITHGDNQKAISPEITLTKRGSGTALSESPANPDVLWVGTDDGAVQVTKDGGKTWTNMSDKFKAAGLPGPRWVSSIEASKAKEGRAYVAFDAHRSDDDEPYLFVTEDFGATWKSIRGNLPVGSTRVLREDIANPNLLYCGTEFGAWASIDRGVTWSKINGGDLPTVAVHEFAQPTVAGELVLATHGRSIWIADVTTLRQATPEVVAGRTALFKPENVVRWQLDSTREGMFETGTRRFVGTNPDRGGHIEYFLAKQPEKLTLALLDVNGKSLRALPAPRAAGVNRVAIPAGAFRNIPAGAYRVLLTVDGTEYSQTLTVENDPNTLRAGAAFDFAAEERKMRKLLSGAISEWDDE